MSSQNPSIQIAANENCKFDIKEFNTRCGIIYGAYQNCLEFSPQGLKQISIDLYYRKISLCITEFKGSGASYAIVISRWLDWEQHFAKSIAEQTQEILDTLHDSMLLMCEKYNFDRVPFDEAYRKVMEANFEHRTLHNKPTLSKNRKTKAAIEVNIQADGARINVLFTNPTDQTTERREVVRLKPNYYFISQLIHKGKWIDNEHYAVSDRRNVVQFIASTQSATVETAINARDDEHRARIVEKLDMLRV